MSPVRKKKAARTSQKRTSAAKKTAAKKAAGKKSSAKKATPKKAAGKKAPAKKATPKKKEVAKKSPAKKATPKKDAGKKAPAKKTAIKPSANKSAASKAGAAKGKKVVPVPLAVHPRFGKKFECFGCGARFYDLGREEPICPKCEIDQREKPSNSAPAPAVPARGKRTAAARPMAPLLDDEEEMAAPAEEDIQSLERKARSGEKLFDDAAVAGEESEEGSS